MQNKRYSSYLFVKLVSKVIVRHKAKHVLFTGISQKWAEPSTDLFSPEARILGAVLTVC